MNRDKQKIISDICPFYKKYGTCDQCNTALAIDDEPGYWECMANAIINNGDRKASDVAREIFEEIDKLTVRYINDADYTIGDMILDIIDLKKKHEGEGAE